MPDEHQVEHGGGTTTVGELSARGLRIGDGARAVIYQSTFQGR